jgi:hypothetical protein
VSVDRGGATVQAYGRDGPLDFIFWGVFKRPYDGEAEDASQDRFADSIIKEVGIKGT